MRPRLERTCVSTWASSWHTFLEHPLLGKGLGTMVAVALPNSIDHFYASLGAWKAGAGVIPMRWDVPPWERDRLLETSGVVLVVGDDAANMQWLTIQDHRQKTRVEVKLCRRRK